MTTPFWALFFVCLIPYVLAAFGGYQRKKQLGVVDNNNWRSNQLPHLTGMAARTYSAQANSWEAVALGTAAVTVAHLAGADVRLSAIAALLFLAARLIYVVLYLVDLATLRTLVFLVGWASCLWLFGLAMTAPAS